MDDKLNFFLSGIAITLVIVGALWWAAQTDKKLQAKAECVANLAQTDYYQNGPYAKSAWDKYSDKCK